MDTLGKTYESLIVLLSLAFTVGFGLAAVKIPLHRTPAEFFLGGRSTRALTIGLTLFAGSLWNLLPIGFFTGVATGSALVLAAAFSFGLLLLGIIYTAAYNGEPPFTVPEVLGRRMGRNMGLVMSFLYLVLLLCVRIPLSIFLGTHLLQSTVGWEPLSSGLLMVVLPGLLAVAGGFPAVIAAQRVQAVVAVIGLLVIAMVRIPLSSLVIPFMPGTAVESWIPFILAMAILGIWHGCLDQSSAQRAFAARSSKDVKWGTAIAAVVLLVGIAALISDSLPGLVQLDLSRASIARGSLGATILALAMVSLSADFLSLSTVTTMDVFRRFRASVDSAGLVLIGRISLTLVVLVSILAVSSLLLAEGALGLTTVHAGMLLVAPVVAVSTLGLFWQKVRALAAVASLAAGWLLAAAYFSLVAATGMELEVSIVLPLGLFIIVGVLCLVMSLLLSRRVMTAPESAAVLGKRLDVRKP